MCEEAEESETVVDRDDDHIFPFCKAGSVADDFTARSCDHSAAVYPDEYGKLVFLRLRRGPDVQIEAVFFILRRRHELRNAVYIRRFVRLGANELNRRRTVLGGCPDTAPAARIFRMSEAPCADGRSREGNALENLQVLIKIALQPSLLHKNLCIIKIRHVFSFLFTVSLPHIRKTIRLTPSVAADAAPVFLMRVRFLLRCISLTASTGPVMQALQTSFALSGNCEYERFIPSHRR